MSPRTVFRYLSKSPLCSLNNYLDVRQFHDRSSIKGIQIINLLKHLDMRSGFPHAEIFKKYQFEIIRIFWAYDVSGWEARGGHAFKQNEECVIALMVDDGQSKQRINLKEVLFWWRPSDSWAITRPDNDLTSRDMSCMRPLRVEKSIVS